MKRKSLLFLLLMAFFAPWVANAQETLTVYADGTKESYYVPINVMNFFSFTRAQTVFPATDLSEMAGGTITSITFYTTNANILPYTTNASADVYLTEVTGTTLSAFVPKTSATTVYSGYFNFVSDGNGGGMVTITLTTPYLYQGGNLLFGCDNTEKGGYSGIKFKCKNAANGASISGAAETQESISASKYSLLPKTTFTYTKDYPKPQNLAYENLDPNTTLLTWTAPETEKTVTGYAYQYKKASAGTWPAEETVADTSVTLGALTSATAYNFRVKTLYDSNASEYATINFTTADNCMTPEDLSITNVNWNSATITWNEEYGDGQWKLGYKKSTETSFTEVDVNLAQLPYTLGGLDAATTYDVKIYPLCDATKSIMGSFTTQCAPVTSTIDNFDSYTGAANGKTNNLPACWNYINTSTDINYKGYPVIYNVGGTNAYSGTNVLRFYSYTGGDPKDQYAILPPMENVNTLRLQMYAKSLYGASCIVGVMTDPTDANTFVPVEIVAPTTNTYTKFRIDLNGYTGMGNYIAIKMAAASSPNYRGIQIDNLVVKPIPTCQDVDAVTAFNVSNYSAQLGWTAAEGQNAWQIAYKAGSNFDPNNDQQLASATTIDVTANPYTFSHDLTANTHYYMYVRANCGGTDNYSDWSDTYADFTTKIANPAPTNVIVPATGIWSSTADVYWTPGGGDDETSWEVYYTNNPQFNINNYTGGAVVVNTLPTEEAPFTIESLIPETTYRLWVRAKHGTNSYSAWTQMTGNSFTTTSTCVVPRGIAATNILHTSADLTWAGDPNYTGTCTVQHRTAAYTDEYFFEDFENGIPDAWTLINQGDDEDWTTTTDFDPHGTAAAISYSMEYADNWLITPLLDLQGTLKFYAIDGQDEEFPEYFEVRLSTTGTDIDDFTEVIRSMDPLPYASDWQQISVNLNSYAGQQGYIAIHHVTEYGWFLAIDDFGLYGTSHPAGDWITDTGNATETMFPFANLAMNTKYDARVKANCNDQYCTPVTFTTLKENEKVFTTAGNWTVADNWIPAGEPEITDDVIIRANATIPNECDALANSITFEGTPTPTLTIKDGGQLFTNREVMATVEKEITGYTSTKDHYYLIGNPLSSAISNSTYSTPNTTSVGLVTSTSDYDLYQWSRTSEFEWSNYETSTFSLYNGTGYLYANSTNVTLTFTGTVKANNIPEEKSLTYGTDVSGEETFKAWNLLANPFVCKAFVTCGDATGMAYYKMNGTGTGFEASTAPVNPMEGIFVHSDEEGSKTVTFSRYTPVTNPGDGNLYINVAQIVGTRDAASATDNAIINFGNISPLEKFSFREGCTKVYIPMDGKNYAVVNAEAQGEMPVSFKAEKNGNYTLSFNIENIELGYLHLIDNLTGNDVDLLQTPSYNFEASTTDYASRFKLVFSTQAPELVEGPDQPFAFMSDGNLIVSNKGEATLQVIDVNGRIVRSESINNSASVNLNTVPGIYMLRLINGENVKVQKVVVR